MIFLPAANDEHAGLTHRLVSDGGLIHMGVFRVNVLAELAGQFELVRLAPLPTVVMELVGEME